jgi:hypothetical protein
MGVRPKKVKSSWTNTAEKKTRGFQVVDIVDHGVDEQAEWDLSLSQFVYS